jgi:Bacterial Ig-like domain (group 2)
MKIALALASALVLTTARADDIGIPIEPLRYVNNNGETDSPSPWGFRIDDAMTGLATDGQGVWVSAWAHTWSWSTPVCTAYDVLFARSADDGATWSDPAYLNLRHQNDDPDHCVSNADYAHWAKVATDRQGTWLLFGRYNDLMHGGDNDIGIWRSTDNGLTFTGPEYLNTDAGSDASTEDDYAVNVVATGDGAWVAVWNRSELVSPGQFADALMIARSADGGATWSSPQRLFPSRSQYSDTGPDLKEHGGILALTWNGWVAGSGAEANIYVSRSFDHGQSWTTPVGVAQEDNTNYIGAPSLAMIDGAWLIAYAKTPDPSVFWDVRVRLIRSTSLGAIWSAPVEVAQLDSYNNTGSGHRIASDRNNNVFLLMTSDTDAFGTLHNFADTYVMRSRDGGLSWTEPRQPLNSNYPGVHVSTSLFYADASDKGRWLIGGSKGGPGLIYDADPVVAGFRVVDIEVVDPNPDLLNGPEVTTDPVLLATIPGRQVFGVAADGVSRVLLRLDLPTAGTVDFSISGANSQDTQGVGWLAEPGGTSGTTELSVATHALANNRFVAFAVLRAPREFTEDAQQPADATDHAVLVSAVFHPSGGGGATSSSKWLVVERPPVVFMHGLWSSAFGSWGDGSNVLENTWPLFWDDRFMTTRGDYSATNADSFKRNLYQPHRWTRWALTDIRTRRGLAATQVDYVGHSMGGLLGRMYAADLGHDYVRDDNYGAGDFRKLITVDTPHWGSPLANIIDEIETSHPLCRRLLDPLAAGLHYCLTCGAVRDLRTDSAEIAALPPVSVPTHAIAGVGGSTIANIAGWYVSTLPMSPRALPLLLQTLGICGVGPNSLFGSEDHDLVVSLPSQSGGLVPASNTDVFDYLPGPERQWAIHTSVTHETRVGDTVLALLDTPTTDTSVWGTLPSGNPSSPSIPFPAYGSLRPGLAFVLPLGVTHVQPGGTLTLTVVATDGFVPTSVHVQTDWDMQTASSPPFTVTLNVPPDAIGPAVVHAFAFDAEWNLAEAADMDIVVDVAATLDSVTIDPDLIVLYTRTPSAQVTVIGHYADGVDRSITSSGLGTTYWSADPSIASIDANGVVTGTGVGSTDVYAQNGTGNGSVGFLLVRVFGLAMKLSASPGELSWTFDDEAQSYDLVRGDLHALRAAGGDFAPTVRACVASHSTATNTADMAVPSAGEAWYYVLRSRYAGTLDPGTWDDGAPGQQGSRDAGIAASANGCP